MTCHYEPAVPRNKIKNGEWCKTKPDRMMIKKGGGGTKKIITDVYDYKGEDRETLSMCCRARLNACLKRKSRLPCLQSTRHRESNVRINKEKGESLCTPPILTIQVGVVYCAVCVPSAR